MPNMKYEKKEINKRFELYDKGYDYHAYEYLGAHILRRGGENGAVFRLWAPEAKKVYVIGEFNEWQRENGAMSRLSHGIWELFVPGAKQYDMYRYVIGTKNGKYLEKSDPVAFHTETRPATASKIYDTSLYEWGDTRWLAERASRQSLTSPINIYEVHLGSWRRGENGEEYTYKRMGDELIPYVKRMGYTHVEIMPIMEHPLDASWGYQCLGYFAPTSRFGSPEDFCRLVDRFHQAGIGVILDWVPGHFPKDEFGLIEFDGYPLYEDSDPLKREHPDWGTRIFDFGRGGVRSFLISSAMFWLERYHADGFRIDAVASMLYLDFGRHGGQWRPNKYGGKENLEAIEFLRRLTDSVRKTVPDAVLIAEESTAWPMVTKPAYAGGLGFHYKWNMGWMNDVLNYIKVDPLYRSYHQNEITFSLTYAFAENYVLPFSHDEVVHMKNSLIGRMPGEYKQKFAGLRALYGYMTAHPGKKLLFMGGEFGQFSEWDFAGQLDWHLLDYETHVQMLEFTRKLNLFYKDTPALWDNDDSQESFRWISGENYAQNILTFLRISKKGDEVAVCVNFSPVARAGYRIGVDRYGVWEELFNTDSTEYGGAGETNPGPIMTDGQEWNGLQYSITITIPSLGVAFIGLKKAMQPPVNKSIQDAVSEDRPDVEN